MDEHTKRPVYNGYEERIMTGEYSAPNRPAKRRKLNTPPEMVRVDRTNGASRPLKWCMATAAMVH